jgi:hypothetical protein
MRSALRPVAALATLAVIVAGCSNAPAGTANGGDGGTAVAREKAVKFAECMRNNGVTGFPDPDASGALTIDGVVNGSSLDPNSAAWKRAIGACQSLEPSGFTGHRRTPEQQKAALVFAQCIRDHGVHDFPDPTVDGPLVDTTRIPSTTGSGGLSILNAAMRACRSFAAAAGVTRS